MQLQPMSYNLTLVALSFLVALMASYAALDMGSRLRRASGRTRWVWLGGSAVVLGGGIWSMHFIAMLAMSAGIPIGYDFDLTALSLITAIAIVAFGLHLVARERPSILRQIGAGVIVGAGVSAMHYTGMAAMILDGAVRYQPPLVAASIAIAVVAASAALWLTLNLTRPWQRVAAAAVMAVAVCGMHYTAMSAASILCGAQTTLAVDPQSKLMLAAAVALGTFMILCLAMVCVFADRRFEFLAEREAESLRTANKALTDSRGAIKDLLDNADQGFLTVGPDLRVAAPSSAACEAILGRTPTGASLVDLLCPLADDSVAVSMRETLESAFQPSSDLARELKLELLPSEFSLEDRFVTAAYKFLSARTELMVVLTDVTQTRLLAAEVERERRRLEMIVLAVTEGEAFAALVGDYQTFLDELPDLTERLDAPGASADLYRRLHTFKGLLAQFSFLASPQALHAAETALAGRLAGEGLAAPDLRGAFEADLSLVVDALGSEFGGAGRHLKLSSRQLGAMEKLARTVLAGEAAESLPAPLRLLLQTLADLGRLDVKAALSLHSRAAPALATRLDKQLATIVVEGDDVALPPEVFSPFFRSLVHVYRNAVDHGIETPEERELCGKPAEGVVRCEVRDGGDFVEIVISDDGRGIDRAALEARLSAKGIAVQQPQSLEDLVFREGLSSRAGVTDLSGRGVGLAAVKHELDRLGGAVAVTSTAGAGACFRFRLPASTRAPRQDIAA